MQILKNIHTHVSAEKMLSRAIRLVVKMMLFYCGKFHSYTSSRLLTLSNIVPASVKIVLFGVDASRDCEIKGSLNAKNPDAHTQQASLK